MSRVAALLLAIAGLPACSDDAPRNERVRRETPAPATPAVHAPVAAPVATGTGLRASVSDLKGAVSGLNVRITDQETIIDLPFDALFDFDEATLTPAAAAQLAKAASLIRRSPPGPIGIVGHTDDTGEDAYNQRLSEARARTVADWFAGQVGVRTRRFDVSGKGETAPIAPNSLPGGGDDPAGRARNRRVEVIVPNAAPPVAG